MKAPAGKVRVALARGFRVADGDLGGGVGCLYTGVPVAFARVGRLPPVVHFDGVNVSSPLE
jgi:hypothetical protein